jgi:hypothetical protein
MDQNSCSKARRERVCTSSVFEIQRRRQYEDLRWQTAPKQGDFRAKKSGEVIHSFVHNLYVA